MSEKPKNLPVKRESLGQLAAVLLPLEKLKLKSTRGIAFEQEIHDFLLTNFNGYTVSSGNILFTLIGFAGMYLIMGLLYIVLMVQAAVEGPEAREDDSDALLSMAG